MQGRREDEGSLQIGDSFLGVPKRDDDRFHPQNCQSNWLHSMWKSPWDWKLFSTGGASARSLWKQWQHQAIPSRSCQRLSSKLPVGHKKLEKSHFWCWTYTTIILVMARYGFPHPDGGSLFHFWIALFPTRLKLGISFAFHYSSPNQIYRHINLSIAKKN